MRSHLLIFSALLGCTVALGASGEARAQEATTTGAATALFDEGVSLMEKGNYADACPKLARSNELSPNGGTLFALAECYERAGKVASAWVTYKEAAIRAHAAQRPDAEQKATDSADRLGPNVSRLTLELAPDAAVDGLEVKLDGRAVATAELGVATPIDPGPHKIVATAPGHLPVTRDVTIDRIPSKKTITIPVLDIAPVEKAPSAEEGPPPGRTQRILGLVSGGLGLGGIAVGTVFGLQASSKNHDASAHCTADNRCDAAGISLDHEGRDAATISTVAFIAGGVLTAGGIVLVLTAPSAKTPPSSAVQEGRLMIHGTPGGAAMTFGARF